MVENVESELVGVCLSEALGVFGKARVYEVDTTGRTPRSILREIWRVASPDASGNRVKGRVGVVDWLGTFEPERWKGRGCRRTGLTTR